MGDFHDPASTYAEALENLTEENWHRERELIEAEVDHFKTLILRLDDSQEDRMAVVDTISLVAEALRKGEPIPADLPV
jgi:hypothetical protein